VPDGHLFPHAQEALVRLGSELPFGRVAEHLEGILGVVVHASTARRHSLEAGQRVLEVQNEQAQPLASCPQEQAAERMAMSSDGAMVPLVGGVWADARAGGDWRGRTPQAQGRGANRDDAPHVLCTYGQRRDVC